MTSLSDPLSNSKKSKAEKIKRARVVENVLDFDSLSFAKTTIK